MIRRRRNFDQVNPYQEDFSSNLTNGIFGLAGATFFGPAGALLGAAGAIVGKAIIREHLAGKVLDRLYPNRDVLELVREKFIQDFNHSFLQDHNNMSLGFSLSTAMLNEAGLINDRDPRILKNSFPPSSQMIYSGEGLIALIKPLLEHKTINVCLESIQAGALAVLFSLKSKLQKYDITLNINYDEVNGHNLVLFSENGDFDFSIYPNDAFFMIENAQSSKYRLMFVVNAQIQHLFRRKIEYASRYHQIQIYQDSSADMHRLIGVGIPEHSEKRIIDTMNKLSTRIAELPAGDMIIVWEPLTHLLNNNPDFEIVSGSRYRVWNSFYCHKRWNKPSMDTARESFATLFIQEWNICNAYRKEAFALIKDNPNFITKFAQGAGINY